MHLAGPDKLVAPGPESPQDIRGVIHQDDLAERGSAACRHRARASMNSVRPRYCGTTTSYPRWRWASPASSANVQRRSWNRRRPAIGRATSAGHRPRRAARVDDLEEAARHRRLADGRRSVQQKECRHHPPCSQADRSPSGQAEGTTEVLDGVTRSSGGSPARLRKGSVQGHGRVLRPVQASVPVSAPRRLASAGPLGDSSRLLDLACGTGQIPVPLAGDVAEVWAVDQEARRSSSASARANNWG